MTNNTTPYLYNEYDFRFQFYHTYSMCLCVFDCNSWMMLHDYNFSIIFHGNYHLAWLWFHNISIHLHEVERKKALGYSKREATALISCSLAAIQ